MIKAAEIIKITKQNYKYTNIFYEKGGHKNVRRNEYNRRNGTAYIDR